MFIKAVFTMAKSWKQPKCPSMDEWTNEMQCIHTMEYHSALIRKEILSHATIQRDLKNFTLSEINQSQKDRYFMIALT